MSLERNDPPSGNEPVDWGVIILTGIVAVALVVSGGLLARRIFRVPHTLSLPAFSAPSSTPPNIITQPTAGFAIRAKAQGHWESRVTVTMPDGSTQVYTTSGQGRDPVTFVNVTQPTGSTIERTTHFEITIFFPVLTPPPAAMSSASIVYASRESYLDGLGKQFYVIYDANSRMLQVTDDATQVAHLEIRDWQAVK